jgi:hypothetical protein
MVVGVGVADRVVRYQRGRRDGGSDVVSNEGTCPACGDGTWRESVDVGVGIIYGPFGCRTDQWGYLYPTDEAAPGARDSEDAAEVTP